MDVDIVDSVDTVDGVDMVDGVDTVDGVDGVLLSANFLFLEKDFFQISVFVSPLRGSSLGGLHPRFRFASPGVTHGCASPRLGAAFRPPVRRTLAAVHNVHSVHHVHNSRGAAKAPTGPSEHSPGQARRRRAQPWVSRNKSDGCRAA